MRLTDLLRAVRIAAQLAAQTLSRRTLASGATLAILCLLALPARAQDTTCINTGVTSKPGTGSFYSNFASTSTQLSTYAIQLTPNSGNQLEGDANSVYFGAYYSITNALALMANSGYCPFELVIVGDFPETRYFSIADYDMHYSPAQHISDADIDPVGCIGSCTHYTNPFIQGNSFTANQPYMVSISLGSIPGPTVANGGTVANGCLIDPWEGDNLLDATQRHPSMDWNTIVTSSAEAAPAPPASAHVVDNTGHSVPGSQSSDGQNRAGEILVRNYLLPTLSGCTDGSPGSCTTPPSLPTSSYPYLLIRDVYSGCAYNLSETSVYDALVNNNTTGTGTNQLAVVTVGADPSAPGDSYYTNWLDQGQEQNHDNLTLVTQQGCFANGNPDQLSTPTVGPPYFYNRAAWVRSPEWVGVPGADDSYIAAQISAGNLSSMAAAGRAIRMRFQLPVYPDIPCTASGCELTGSEQLRYWSLSFVQAPVTGSTDALTVDPDGVNPLTSAPPTLVSLADTAFCTNSTCAPTVPSSCATTPCYVELIVGTGATMNGTLYPELLGSTAVGSIEGAIPVTTTNTTTLDTVFSVYLNNGYTVLDLSQINGFNTANPLQLVVRNTLPNTANFSCSGQTVPYGTALYTNVPGPDDSITGSSLMGPYIPLVDYPELSSLTSGANTTSGTLPSATYCGMNNIPGPPYLTPATALSLTGDEEVQWPTYWPASSPSTQNLYCGGSVVQPTSPTVYFAASLRPSPEDYTACSPPGPSCNYIYALSNQSDAFSSPTPPPLPVTIVGTGFGYLPQTLPAAVQSSSFLEIHDDMAAGGSWDTNGPASCQMYIADWTDTSISLVANIPLSATDDASTDVLSPLSDISPLTFFTSAASQNTWNCPVANGDTLTFTVKNPQHTGATPGSDAVCVGTPGTPSTCPL
jgi:hypothetical protein